MTQVDDKNSESDRNEGRTLGHHGDAGGLLPATCFLTAGQSWVTGADHNSSDSWTSHLEKTKAIIAKDYPEYLPAFNEVMKRTWGHMFNMFIMKKSYADEYCAWLFDILFKVEKQIDFSSLPAFDARLFGRISELLLDVWIETNGYSHKEIKMIQMGNENWPQKIKYFLAAKFFGKKYTQSR